MYITTERDCERMKCYTQIYVNKNNANYGTTCILVPEYSRIITSMISTNDNGLILRFN